MHEVGVMQDALELALAHADKFGARRIVAIKLRIGPLAGVEPEALTFAFDVVTSGTKAEGARLQIEDVPLVCMCPGCSAAFEPYGWIFECPRCQRTSSDVRQGRELELTSVEIA